MIELSVKIPLKTYRNFIYAQSYRRGSTILVTTISVVNLAAYVLYLAGPLRDVLSSPAVSLIFGVVLTFGVPLVIHYSTASTFLTNKYLQEECSWTISRQGIQINGQT